MRPRVSASAFAPGVISNFFSVHGEGLSSDPPDLERVGATGGGFTLSRGVTSRVVLGTEPGVRVTVNSDTGADASTTIKAVELLLASTGIEPMLEIHQIVDVPVGFGFGSSSASSLSAVMAANEALGMGLGREEVALFAHSAEILCGTGLGTVSSTYRHTGAGVVVAAGAPGRAVVRRVRVTPRAKVLAAWLPWMKKPKLSPADLPRINELGRRALEVATNPLTLERLLRAGELFTEGAGLQSDEVRALLDAARSVGALGAAQNMIGQGVHVIVREEDALSSMRRLRSSSPRAGLAVFGIGGAPARVL